MKYIYVQGRVCPVRGLRRTLIGIRVEVAMTNERRPEFKDKHLHPRSLRGTVVGQF